MSPTGEVKVFIRTRRVPVGRTTLRTPMYTLSGVYLGSTVSHAVLFATQLDESQAEAVRESRRLSSRLGLDLEVIDASKSGPLRRLLSFVRGAAPRQPAFLVSPQAEEGAGASVGTPV